MYVRPATTADVEAVRAVARASWEADYPGTVSRDTIEDAFEEWYAPDDIRRTLLEDAAVVLAAVADVEGVETDAEDPADADGGAVVGFAHAFLDDGTGSILRAYVHPAARRHTVGSRLLTRTVAELYERGAETVEAMALAENDLADEFYRAADFELDRAAGTTVGGETHEENVYVHAGGS